MRILLASLLCLVLGSSQCFAIKGGPEFRNGGTSIVGTYAGVLQGAFDPTNPFSSNSLGVFTLAIPTSGASTGQFVMFAQGRTFNGKIQGVGDTNTAKLKALVNATYDYTLNFTTTDSTGAQTLQSISVTASVNGTLTANVTSGRTASGATSTLLRGTSTLYVDQGRVSSSGVPVISSSLSLTVQGFRQSLTAATGSLSGGTGGG